MSELILLAEPLRLLFGIVLFAGLGASFVHVQLLRRAAKVSPTGSMRRVKASG